MKDPRGLLEESRTPQASHHTGESDRAVATKLCPVSCCCTLTRESSVVTGEMHSPATEPAAAWHSSGGLSAERRRRTFSYTPRLAACSAPAPINGVPTPRKRQRSEDGDRLPACACTLRVSRG